MKKKIIILAILFISIGAYAQQSIADFNYSRNRITMGGMKALGTWGIINIGVGAAGWATADNQQNKYFYQMSTLWGIVNTGLAFAAHAGASRSLANRLTKEEELRAQRVIEKTFLINGAIDFVYIGAGLYTNIRGNTRNNVKQKGYGSSIIMQGLFLLAFDATMYSIQRTNGNRIRSIFEKNALSFTGKSVGIVHTF